MKKILLYIALGVLALLGIRCGVLSLVSDETKIRWIIEGMEEGYNAADASDTTESISRDWRHEGSGVDRKLLRRVIVGQSMQDRDTQTREFLYSVDVPDDLVEIEVDGDRATATCEARFSRLRGGEWVQIWHIRVEASFEYGDNGWELVRSRHDDLEGRGLR